jgi:hypothetical protein
MSTDYRALCAELLSLAEESASYLCMVDSAVKSIDRARTTLAQPEPEGVGDEELLRCYGLAKRDHCYEGPMDDWPKRAERAATVHGLRAILTRYARPTIKPVPGAERLPEPEDCDARGWCWYWHPGEECWEMVPVVTGTLDEWTHWLPHHALPLPTPTL